MRHETRTKEICRIFLQYRAEIGWREKKENRWRWGGGSFDEKIGNQL